MAVHALRALLVLAAASAMPTLISELPDVDEEEDDGSEYLQQVGGGAGPAGYAYLEDLAATALGSAFGYADDSGGYFYGPGDDEPVDENRVKEVFASLDRDRDGKLSVREATQTLLYDYLEDNEISFMELPMDVEEDNAWQTQWKALLRLAWRTSGRPSPLRAGCAPPRRLPVLRLHMDLVAVLLLLLLISRQQASTAVARRRLSWPRSSSRTLATSSSSPSPRMQWVFCIPRC